jgi:pimeloyl-ACP methyl ester carboxylesterase
MDTHWSAPYLRAVPGSGRDSSRVLSDGRTLEYWEGGDREGRPVLVHQGTPATRILGRWGDEAAVAAGVRLVCLNRPGYGGSTTSRVPSLLSTGRDTAELAEHLELAEYAVMGISGGGPFAVATAVADPGRVRALAVVAGVGPWRDLDPATTYVEDRKHLALLDAGDLDAAWAGIRRSVDEELAEWRGLDPEALVDAILAEPDCAPSPLASNDGYRALWAVNMPVIMDGPDGYVFDNLCWGGVWDVDASAVVAPTVVWDADGPGARHGAWYADQIAGSELVICAGESHVDVCDGHWPQVLGGLLRVWS